MGREPQKLNIFLYFYLFDWHIQCFSFRRRNMLCDGKDRKFWCMTKHLLWFQSVWQCWATHQNFQFSFSETLSLNSRAFIPCMGCIWRPSSSALNVFMNNIQCPTVNFQRGDHVSAVRPGLKWDSPEPKQRSSNHTGSILMLQWSRETVWFTLTRDKVTYWAETGSSITGLYPIRPNIIWTCLRSRLQCRQASNYILETEVITAH